MRTLAIGTKVLVSGDVDETGMVEVMTEDHILLNVFSSDLTERSEPREVFVMQLQAARDEWHRRHGANHRPRRSSR